MKSRFYRYFFLILMCFSTSNASFAADLKICNEGIKKCEPLISDISEYKSCMRVACKSYYDEQEFRRLEIEDSLRKKKQEELKKNQDTRPLEEVVTCDYGLRKCDSLSNNKEHYFECVTQSCKNPVKNPDPNCLEGRFLCKSEQDLHQECLGFHCPKVRGKKTKACEAGKVACKIPYKRLWQCIYAICLGPVDNFRNPSPTQKYMMVKDKKTGKKKKVIINNKTKASELIKSPLDRYFLDQGFDPREMKSITPQKFRIYGNPSASLYCSSGLLRCKTEDVRSCICTNGTMPIFLNGTPEPRFTDN